jgi:uncharacterized repeat protein (TIGR03803 family)
MSLNVAWATPKEVLLYDFTRSADDGSAPVGGLVADSSGNLYGTTAAGGSYTDCSPFGQTCGVVFELTPNGNTWTETILYTFTGGSDGGEPLAGLAIDGQGNLYGTTAVGGTFSNGTVFMLSSASGSWTESVLYSFRGAADGAYPQAAPTLHNGTIYGTTYAGGGNSCAPYGCGNVFQLKHQSSGWILNSLHAFTYDADGSAPIGGLFAGPNNTLYGTTSGGGAGFSGTVFQLAYAKGAWTFSLLYTFTGPDGASPEGTLVGQGKSLFGTTYGGGTGSGCFFGSACGTVFSLKSNPSGWKETVLHSFTNNGSDGTSPEAGVILGHNALYGTTYAGGSADEGTVFAITP